MASSKPKRAYHHGDLKKALLAAAWQLIRKHGVAALTLREVARKVGVTHAAPYHHFPTRDALLNELARHSFEALDSAMQRALQAESEPGPRFVALGRAYIDFAHAFPERLQVMFRRQGGTTRESVGDGVFHHLLEAVRCCQAAGVAPEGDPYALALTAWSLVHGFSKLWVEGPLEDMPPYAQSFARQRDAAIEGLVAGWRAQARPRR